MLDDDVYDVFVNSLCFVWRPCRKSRCNLKGFKVASRSIHQVWRYEHRFFILYRKSSVDVQKYAPPEYVIAVRKIIHGDNGMINEYHREDIYEDSILRFAYDYTTRNMFVEKKDENGNIVWQYLDPSKADDYEYYHNGLQQMLSAG